MSAKHEKDYEYPLQINGRRVGNTTRLVDWMVQRWFIDGGVELIGSLNGISDAFSAFRKRMEQEHRISVSSMAFGEVPMMNPVQKRSRFKMALLDGSDATHPLVSCIIPNTETKPTSHD